MGCCKVTRPTIIAITEPIGHFIRFFIHEQNEISLRNAGLLAKLNVTCYKFTLAACGDQKSPGSPACSCCST